MDIQILNDANNNWIVTFIGSIAGALLSGIVAIAIFYFSGKRERKKERKQERKKIKENIAFLGVSIDALKEASIRQIESLHSFINSLDDDKEDYNRISLISGFNPSELFIIERTELFKTLVSIREGDADVKAKHFADLISYILLLIEIKKDLPNQFAHFDEIKKKYAFSFVENYNKIMYLYLEFGQQTGSIYLTRGHDLLFEEFAKIIKNYKSSSPKIDSIYNSIIVPLNQITQKPIYSTDPRMLLLFNSVYGAEVDFKIYKSNFESHKSLFNDVISKIIKSNNVIKSTFDILINNKPIN